MSWFRQNSLEYHEVAGLASAILRCYYFNLFEKKKAMLNFNLGKAMAYTVVLQKMGYMQFIHTDNEEVIDKKLWMVVRRGLLDTYDMKGRHRAMIAMKCQMFEDAIEDMRFTHPTVVPNLLEFYKKYDNEKNLSTA
jgi:hypothetical protein